MLLHRPSVSHRVLLPLEKLQARGRLPGASGYDLAAHSFRVARAHGVPPIELLPPALPGSWMVNNRVTSPVFQRWLAPAVRPTWSELLELLVGGPEAWLALGDTERAAVTRTVSLLCIEGHGIAAVSKVLALLCPETVPLMDDAAIAFALGAVGFPDDAEHPTAGARWFVPMLDWFARSVVDHYDALTAVARAYELAPLDATQVMDRVLWFESWGWRLPFGPGTARWQWVGEGDTDAVVRMDASREGVRAGVRLDLGGLGDDPWATGVRAAIADG